MKKFSLFALAAAGLLLGACSSDDSIDSKVTPGDFTDGAYIGVALQLPSTASATRANEDFDDGETDEFAVKNATLYLFQGTSEATAKYMAQYSIGTSFQADGGTTEDNITSTYCEATLIDADVAAKIQNATNNVYAYVIVNHNGVIPAMDESVTFADFSKWEFSVIGSPVAEEKNIGDGGLLMTSAPICDTRGGEVAAPTAADNYKTLIPIDKTKIFSTADAAKAAPAACIYIERAAVKITVSSKVEKTTLGDDEVAVTFAGWQIINYEPTFYNTRQVEPAWGALASDATNPPFTLWNPATAYRFVSGVAFAPYLPSTTGHTTGFRTYFAKDVQYDKAAVLSKTVAGDTWIPMGNSGYTTENTFDVARMTWTNTTQVTLKAQLGTEDFYTFNGGDVMYNAANIKTLVATSIFNLPTVASALNAALDAVVGDDPDKGKYKGEIVVDFTAPTQAANNVTYTATYKVTKVADGSDVTSTVPTTQASALTAAIEAAKSSFTIAFHKAGYSYYNVCIKHFGDYETPWSSTAPFATVVPGDTNEKIYGTGADADKRFLGRYGVVRDNWYKLEVSAINHIGSAEPEDVEKNGTPDDEIENYIAVHVHILPWVLRNQDVQL